MKISTLALASILTLSAYGSGYEINFRPYISTNLAKVIMVDVDDNTEVCDGSGWITHGDGHKTECPGCSACKSVDGSSNQSKTISCYKPKRSGLIRLLFGIFK